MNKKVKYLGAAAAALLTVAPIAAPVFSSVASVSAAEEKPTVKPVAISLKAPSAKFVDANTETVDSYKTAASFNPTTTVGNIAGVSTVTVTGNFGTDEETGKQVFKAGEKYIQTATVALNNLVADKYYTINGGAPQKANTQGVITDITLTRTLNAVDNSNNVPFFEYDGIAVYGDLVVKTSDGAVNGKLPVNEQNVTSVQSAVDTFLASGKLTAYATPTNSDPITDLAANIKLSLDVKAALQAQGITINKDGSFDATSFYIPLTVTNSVSGKTTTVRLPLSAKKAADKTLPRFEVYNVKQTDGSVTPETLTDGQTTAGFVEIKKGEVFNPTENVNTIKAFASTTNDAQIRLVNVSNNVNSNVPGTYTATFAATNSNNKTATVTVRVRVLSTEYGVDTIKYVPGYGVNVWAVAGSDYARFTGNRELHGASVRTWDKTTVNGVEYTRVTTDNTVSKPEDAKKLNTWVQSRYLASNAAHTNDGETKISGVATVHYNGKGGVALRDAKGHVTYKQYVKNGSQWKVFAKKTVNGKTLYRLGSQSQWILAQYVTVK